MQYMHSVGLSACDESLRYHDQVGVILISGPLKKKTLWSKQEQEASCEHKHAHRAFGSSPLAKRRIGCCTCFL